MVSYCTENIVRGHIDADDEEGDFGDEQYLLVQLPGYIPQQFAAIIDTDGQGSEGEEEFGEEEVEVEGVAQDLRCVASLRDQRRVLFQDCKHLCVCLSCATHFRKRNNEEDDDPSFRCPTCRKAITKSSLTIFL